MAFTKKDLKTGMFVKRKDGVFGVIVNNIIVFQNGKYGELKAYSDSLKSASDSNMNIMAVYSTVCFNLAERGYSLVWERKESILDDIEKKYLSNVICPFRKKVESICKNVANDYDERIVIQFKDGHKMKLPGFAEDTMYVGMTLGKKYSLEELEIQ